MKQFGCIIVDDDEMDRLVVLSYAKRFPLLNIVGVFDSAEKALSFIDKNSIDVAFLDIELEGASGLELRRKALEIPVCVFISSHSESAAETFELQTLDFIVKPFKFPRFEQMMKRLEEFMEVRTKASLFESSLGGDIVYVKTGHDQVKVKLHEILYLEALKNYTILVTENKRHCVLSNLGEILNEEKFNSFLRVHRSYAVQKQYIQKIGSQEIQLSNGNLIPVGRSYKNSINIGQ
ncbi:LytR/AlgR family response regulator transcription factor [Flavobacterium wongokense]|uniref:LytR/AlgR family response regulator transcription factor n=1 Tax=Flavobacterium wongokense TaxID=2910674 RepID=UPI001F1F9572|nr:LytTR family DNA-binding domain-containing protein [Flavobacterium sp. WG47]MCF6131129.1 LytTR family DNA-binding domain-containing protein [Flavobacterium sp. WG47]